MAPLQRSQKGRPGRNRGRSAPVAPIPHPAPRTPRWIPLSPRERRYLQLYDAGKSNKIIADEMDITVNTARTYGRNILVKTMCACLRESATKIGGVRIR